MATLVESAVRNSPLRHRPTDRIAPADGLSTLEAPRLHAYTSLAGLRRAIEELNPLVPVTAVLVLDESFSGHLSSLVRRRPPCCGSRLVIVAESGRLPGLETLGDLAMAGGALGWQEIVLERNAASAIADARASLYEGEDLVVFLPAWHAAGGESA
jgi:hypothetical protein